MSLKQEETKDCLDYVNGYFKDQISKGYKISEIIEAVNDVVLPIELKTNRFTKQLIKRCSQLVSTKYIIQENNLLRSRMNL